AGEALKRKTGARGLRAIIEEGMLEVMYDIPSREGITKVTITKDVILKKQQPAILTTSSDRKGKQREASAQYTTSGLGTGSCRFPFAPQGCRIKGPPSGDNNNVFERGGEAVVGSRMGRSVGSCPDFFCHRHRPLFLESPADPAGQ